MEDILFAINKRLSSLDYLKDVVTKNHPSEKFAVFALNMDKKFLLRIRTMLETEQRGGTQDEQSGTD
ncbi:hypothetical protein J2Z48_002182 [Croceifilum oryzae]|uniref:Uncharacterized protein n=1 Tax=Croceifilum oryzae TaxID=1553429 RepID=A0AAJ1WT27_9BACL|nr:hypothetical protein [Croceifilum oryzae]MDQ0417998.1 hypothetical protein [Croceifilum oryzae]